MDLCQNNMVTKNLRSQKKQGRIGLDTVNLFCRSPMIAPGTDDALFIVGKNGLRTASYR
jgi:hypothetical protein